MKYIKFIAMSLVFMLALLLPGCDEAIYQEYVDACEKTSQLEAVSGSIEYSFDLNKESGDGFSFPMKADYKMRTENGEISQMSMNINYSFLNQDITASTYADKEFMYMDAVDLKTKTPVDKEKLLEYESIASSYVNLSEDVLKNAERTVEDGIVNVVVTFDGNLLREQLIDIFTTSFFQGYNPGMASVQNPEYISDISDANVKYTINADGYIVSESLDFSMTLDVNGTSTSVDAHMALTYDNPGQPVEIEVPNLDEYETLPDEIFSTFSSAS